MSNRPKTNKVQQICGCGVRGNGVKINEGKKRKVGKAY